MFKIQSNKKTGSDFEEEFSKLAFSRGFWVHKMTANRDGQPADVIISRDNMSALVDCKVCENNKFPLSRIEDNQEYAMFLWLDRGNSHAGFALKIKDEIRIINFLTLMDAKDSGKKSFNFDQIMTQSLSFDDWVNSIWK